MEFKFEQIRKEGTKSIHFAHANGFHPRCYSKLFEPIDSDFSIEAMLSRPFYPEYSPSSLNNWEIFSDDFLSAVKKDNRRYDVGMGHSLGGIMSLISAVNHTKIFRKLVLIDPVIFPKKQLIFMRMPKWIKYRFVPIVKIAQNRRYKWKNKEDAYDYLRNKGAYKNIPEDAYHLFIEHCFYYNEQNEYMLKYPREWEARVYATYSNPWPYLSKLTIPTLIIRGKNTDLLTDVGSWADLHKSKNKYLTFAEVPDAGHLVPLEKGPKVAGIINEFIA